MIDGEAEFYSIMREFGGYLATWYKNHNHPAGEQGLANAYYDGEAAGYKLGIPDLAAEAYLAYVPYYVLPANGRVQGYRNFTEGQLQDVLLNTSRRSEALKSIQLQLQNGAYVASGDCSSVDLSRECAYAIETHVNAAKAGIQLSMTQKTRLNQLVNWSIGHVTKWNTPSSVPYYRPFMGGITCRSLDKYFKWSGAVPSGFSIQLTNLCDNTWKLWKELPGLWGRGQSFLYTDRNINDPLDNFTQPDLNNLISPMFAWSFELSKQTTDKDRAFKAFKGGIPVYLNGVHQSGANIGSPENPSGKQFDQQMFWIETLMARLNGPGVIESEREFLNRIKGEIDKRLLVIP